MEIAVTRDSPLGQYLAELDDETGGMNLSAGLLSATPSRSPPAARRCSRYTKMLTALCSGCKSLISRVSLQSELRALDAVYESLDMAWPAWREIHAVELLALEQHDRHALFHQLEPRAFGVITAALVPIVAALAYSYLLCSQTDHRQRLSSETIVSDSVWSPLVALGLVLGCVAALELVFLLLVTRATTQARRLRQAVQSFTTANERFESAFQSSLDLVKKAELASRGYRLGGAFLPPVGRLEKPTDRLQCVELRRLLRSLNEKLLAHTNANLKAQSRFRNDTLGITQMDSSTTNGEDISAPSLLVTALSKRHAAAALAVDNALHLLLLALVSPLWEAQRGQTTDSTHLVLRVRDCQHRLLHSCELFHSWESVLECQSRRVSAMVRADTLLPPTVSSQDRVDHETSPRSTSDHEQFQAIESQLHELWSACETLGSLVVAARHENTGKDDASTEMWVNRLASTRELMEKRVQELQGAWEAYDQALAGALSLSDSGNKPTSDPSLDPEESGIDRDNNAPIRSIEPPKQPKEDDCTVVFTGTSTGEKDFDLQSILWQQQDANSAPTAGRFVVRELRDVLAYREANTRSRTIIKDIDSDTTGSTNGGGFNGSTGVAEAAAATPRELPARQPMCPMDLNAALKSELQGLRLPFATNDSVDEDVLSDGIE